MTVLASHEHELWDRFTTTESPYGVDEGLDKALRAHDALLEVATTNVLAHQLHVEVHEAGRVEPEVAATLSRLMRYDQPHTIRCRGDFRRSLGAFGDAPGFAA